VDINKIYNFSDILEMVTIKTIEFEEEYGVKNNTSVVWKADITRWAKLYEHGGIWFDMDILFIKPIPDSFYSSTAEIVTDRYLGVIGGALVKAVAGNKYMGKLHENSLDIVISGKTDYYQIVAQGSLESVIGYNNSDPLIEWRNIDEVTPIMPDKINLLFEANNEHLIKENTFAIHWFNGSPDTRRAINDFDITKNTTFNKLIEKILYS